MSRSTSSPKQWKKMNFCKSKFLL
ncbi:hypothetical protein CP8484711_1608A, partial [Chlamydia psittaci 84-8471/1]